MGFRTIVKHSYVPADRDALARMKAHVRYIKHRPGHDLEEKERSFFNGRKGQISKSIVMGALENVSKSDPVVAHKLILSPGVPDVDIETYVRSVMRDISRSKGQELTWFAVKHENTAHAHAHVVVMPRDQLGHRVRFTKTDYQTIKKAGDAYADRTKPLEKKKASESPKKINRALRDFSRT
jgi:type IV secretory pathway VirD2 relaxase